MITDFDKKQSDDDDDDEFMFRYYTLRGLIEVFRKKGDLETAAQFQRSLEKAIEEQDALESKKRAAQ